MIVNRKNLHLAATALAVLIATSWPAVYAQDALSRDKILRDADVPVLGNPDGDITIVEYSDYQCPYCKQIAPVVDQVVKEDGKIRMVLKDWPVLGDP